MSDKLTRFRKHAFNVLAVVLCLFVLLAVNRDLFAAYLPEWFGILIPGDDQPKLAVFAMLGMALVFLGFPMFKRWEGNAFLQIVDLVLVAATVGIFGYILVQSEDLFEQFWIDGAMLGERASSEQPFEFVIAGLGILLIFEATRRSIGLTLPLLCMVFVAYAFYGPDMPDWLFPHRGSTWQQLSQKAFLQSGTMCVFGIALNVMFKYVFLFVLFGTVLEQTGATGYVINFARSLFRNSSGGPAKVAVVSSGLMGSLSGSAVANTATTGSFTIPLMKSTGFNSETAAGIEAAASSGGALMPPIMGAGAYMMLEILGTVDPEITYLKIVQAALIPALLYYFALLLSVHFHARRIGAKTEAHSPEQKLDSENTTTFQGFVFFGSFVILIAMLLGGFTPFLAVSVSLVGICVLAAFSKSTRVGPRKFCSAMIAAAKSGTSLIVAASCVGIILGVVDMSGLGPALPAKVQVLAGDSSMLALLLLMVSTIILGMGLPSAVCYLLVALTVSSVLTVLDTPPLAAHLFIFYFGMMSMVTPPVALAAYAGAAIADANIIRSAFAAFRFALVGFALPFAFVIKPELLMLTIDNQPASILMIAIVVGLTIIAIVGLAASVAGYAFSKLGWPIRIALLACSLTIFLCRLRGNQIWIQAIAAAVIAVAMILHYRLSAAKVATT
jgi:TRAP transporter 4TM/12TM fusion protein